MTLYDERMERVHHPACEYPKKFCICRGDVYITKEAQNMVDKMQGYAWFQNMDREAVEVMVGEKEEHFTVKVEVEVDAFGLTQVHGVNIINRIAREMQLLFGDRAKVTHVPMDSQEVQRLGEEQDLSEV